MGQDIAHTDADRQRIPPAPLPTCVPLAQIAALAGSRLTLPPAAMGA
eukprot:CAMPEP_0177588394 /NCGR_PEP_ID=MMETSP0419_2-20121207/6201_1 /TAXON_ID=582737 /ORGANISM="Tetraselmis sp., Strain GSL018" /LENGTH=46 /DNA_ID= /DNA_START= /DNA_END= /DNA_ORIENTATION=